MTATCPNGHPSSTDDYCDTCGAAISAAPTPAPTAASPSLECANCGTEHAPDELFCEVCGLDFSTGKLPDPPPPPAPAGPAGGPADRGADTAGPAAWTLTIAPDRAFFDTNQAETPTAQLVYPSDRQPLDVALHADEVLIGRRSDSGGVYPEVDLTGVADDPGVSRRHATLRRAGDAWELVDNGSTNGTRINDGRDPVAPGRPFALGDGDRVHIGAWTCLTLRHTEIAGS